LLKTLTGLVATAVLTLPATALAGSANPPVSCTGGTISFSGADTLWPPNHKFHDYSVTATPTFAGDMVDLMSTISNDEVIDGTELNGSGNTAVDATNNPGHAMGMGTQTVLQSIRSERSGRGDGRTYTFTVEAKFGAALIPCDATFTVNVPHDHRSS
jgi:hypothetical protein